MMLHFFITSDTLKKKIHKKIIGEKIKGKRGIEKVEKGRRIERKKRRKGEQSRKISLTHYT